MTNLAFPKRTYQLIYADPPWAYNDRKLVRKDGKKPAFGLGAVNHYSVMDYRDIASLPVADLATDSAVLFMWATFPMLPEALYVMNHWKFKYKTIGFNWVKTNKDGSPFFGVGHYTRSNSEVCLIGTKGNFIKPACSVSSIIMSEKEEHSKKPHEVYNRLELMYPELSKIELFARNTREGWTSWGNEI